MFEIYTSDGHHFKCEDDTFTWQHGLVEGSMELLDKTVVEVIDEDGDVYLTFANVIAVGDFDATSCVATPRVTIQQQCPRCGFTPK